MSTSLTGAEKPQIGANWVNLDLVSSVPFACIGKEEKREHGSDHTPNRYSIHLSAPHWRSKKVGDRRGTLEAKPSGSRTLGQCPRRKGGRKKIFMIRRAPTRAEDGVLRINKCRCKTSHSKSRSHDPRHDIVLRTWRRQAFSRYTVYIMRTVSVTETPMTPRSQRCDLHGISYRLHALHCSKTTKAECESWKLGRTRMENSVTLAVEPVSEMKILASTLRKGSWQG